MFMRIDRQMFSELFLGIVLCMINFDFFHFKLDKTVYIIKKAVATRLDIYDGYIFEGRRTNEGVVSKANFPLIGKTRNLSGLKIL